MKTITHLWPNLFRAIEIAKTGNHTVSVHFDKEYTNGYSDLQEVKKFCKGFFENFVDKGDLRVEIHSPHYSMYTSRPGETLDDIQQRVKQSKQVQLKFTNLNDSSTTLLKTAIERLHLSLAQSEMTKHVAITIAKLDGSPFIEAQHIAEAINYQIVHEEVRFFGDKIAIESGEITKTDALAAIEYLKTFIS